MSNFEPRFDFEENWNYVKKHIKKLQNNIEGLSDTRLNSEDYIMLYTNIFNIYNDYSDQLYEKYTEVIHEYITSMVLPCLQGKKDEVLLRELLRRWSNHKTMTVRLSRIFDYLERYYVQRRSIPSLQQTSFLSFYHLVCERFNKQVMDAILAMMDQKLAGETIDETLINNIMAFYSEIGENTNIMEPKEFAKTMMMKVNATLSMHVEVSN